MFSKTLCSMFGIILAMSLVSCAPTDKYSTVSPGEKQTQQHNGLISIIPEDKIQDTILGTDIELRNLQNQFHLMDENTLLVYLVGSSSCKPTPMTVEDENGILMITLKEYNGACTADLRPVLWQVELPESMTPRTQIPEVVMR